MVSARRCGAQEVVGVTLDKALEVVIGALMQHCDDCISSDDKAKQELNDAWEILYSIIRDPQPCLYCGCINYNR